MQGRNKIPVVTIILAAINVLAYGYVEWKGSSYDAEFMLQMGAVYEPFILENHEYYRLITHFFLHFGFEHLVNNMVSLIILGYALENVMGRVRYIVLYFLSGILAGVTSIVYNEVTRYILFIGLSLYSGTQDISIDNAAHIGGFITGFLICLLMSKKKRMEVTYES